MYKAKSIQLTCEAGICKWAKFGGATGGFGGGTGAGTSLHIYRQMSSQTVVVVVLGSTVAKVAKKAQLLISALHILTRVAKVTKTTVTVY